MKFRWKLIVNDIRAQILFILVAISLINVFEKKSLLFLIYPLIFGGLFCLLDLIYTYFLKKRLYLPLSSMVSGLLIGLIIDPFNSLHILLTAVVIAFIGKSVLKFKHRHIFNPAALGIVISTTIYQQNVSWWGVANGGINLLLIFLSIFVLSRLRRYHMPLIFLLGYFIFLFNSSGWNSAVRLTFDGTLFLFSFIMLTEPLTSRQDGRWKYLYPFLVLILVILLNRLSFVTSDPLLTGLLITNFISKVF